jgi:AraC-like DNA-binding protein
MDYFPPAQWRGIGDDFCMFNVRYDERLHTLDHPCRFDGLLMLYCIEGHLKLSVNLNEYDIRDNHLVITTPGHILKVSQVAGSEQLKYVIVAMSSKFAMGLKVDLKKIMNEGIALMEIPVMKLDEGMSSLMQQHLSLVANVINSDSSFREDSVTSIVSSMICLVAGLWADRINELREEAAQTTTRSRMVLEQFIRLVGQYHTKYRNVGFYADKLCLTPKYLSKLIKTASGKSAPEWIDSYVILEAKNLLKYSDIAIKEIVYRLNFPNQSVFYKFFKARTGMTPSEYRNS